MDKWHFITRSVNVRERRGPVRHWRRKQRVEVVTRCAYAKLPLDGLPFGRRVDCVRVCACVRARYNTCLTVKKYKHKCRS